MLKVGLYTHKSDLSSKKCSYVEFFLSFSFNDLAGGRGAPNLLITLDKWRSKYLSQLGQRGK